MEILLTLTYVAFCVAVFKLFRIPVNQWTLATAALGGIFGLALLFITMAYNHPFSTNARIYFTVTPILPSVRGRGPHVKQVIRAAHVSSGSNATGPACPRAFPVLMESEPGSNFLF